MALDRHERTDRGRLAFFVDAGSPASNFQNDVIAGLSQHQKSISPKYFYDSHGARLFEAITRLPEYYVPVAEAAAMQQALPEIANLAGPGAFVIEPGAGASEKIRALLAHLVRPYGAALIDISGDGLQRAAMRVAEEHPSAIIGAIAADFVSLEALPREAAPAAARRIVFFPGSTIGNFDRADAIDLLKRFRSWLQPGDALLIGTDRVKDAATLDAAYNDAAGVTAAFNRNLIIRLNRELHTQLDPNAFAHNAFFVPARSRIEMHLRALTAQTIRIDDHAFTLTAGETIHTENSAKFDEASVRAMIEAAGFGLSHRWTDPAKRFQVSWCPVA